MRIETGLIRGAPGDGVTAFEAIPYAQPPVGAFRWRAPRPALPWSGVRAADGFGPSCMQPDDVPKSEDCLTLNVWRPTTPSDRPWPVMVWIHGGALVHGGSAQYPADALARQGVVVVSLNYRLGRLGFFAHPALAAEAPDDVRGDYGYLDQLAALRWIARNINVFGGDPKQVTIFGDSGSVLVHLTSPLARGLFQQAILEQPGGPTARAKALPLTDLAEAERRATEYALELGVTGDKAATLAGLRALPADKLVEGASVRDVLAARAVGAYVSGVSGAILDGRLLTETPEAALAERRQAMTPILVGADSRHLTRGVAASKDELFALFGRHADEARKLYDPQGDQTLEALKQEVFDDAGLAEPARHVADEMAEAGQPVWLYRFSYVAEAERGTPPTTPSAWETPYVFDLPETAAGDKTTANDRAAATLVSAYWAAFARTGDPNGAGRPRWPRHDPASDQVTDFANDGMVVGPDPLKPRLDLWRAVYDDGG